jgi:hypothetical protein
MAPTCPTQRTSAVTRYQAPTTPHRKADRSLLAAATNKWRLEEIARRWLELAEQEEQGDQF